MSKKTEDLVRDYLNSVGSTDKPAVDKEAVKALKTQVRNEGDPIEKLRLLAALEEERQGRVPDRSAEEAAFVENAKTWAEGEQIPVSAFQALHVPDDMLRKAGFSVTAATTTGGTRRSARAPRIPLDEVAAVVRGLGTSWTLADLADKLDRDPATVRNYVAKLIENGQVEDIGEDPSHAGRGRAPKRYRVT